MRKIKSILGDFRSRKKTLKSVQSWVLYAITCEVSLIHLGALLGDCLNSNPHSLLFPFIRILPFVGGKPQNTDFFFDLLLSLNSHSILHFVDQILFGLTRYTHALNLFLLLLLVIDLPPHQIGHKMHFYWYPLGSFYLDD